MIKYSVGDLFNNKGKVLSLSIITGKEGFSRTIVQPEINRLGLALTGHFTHFPAEQIHIWGAAEQTYAQKLSPETRLKVFKDLINSYSQMPCIIVTKDFQPPEELIDLCGEYKLPLMKTSGQTSEFLINLYLALEEQLAPSIQMHGVLVEIYGLGVLITGESGIGKSECALELIKRGHMLVADDIVKIRRRTRGILVGSAEKIISHHIEVRGLGIIDVQSIFGLGAIMNSAKIELVVKLEEWNLIQEYDRLGIEEKVTNILGTNIPEIIMPVRQGRNLAVLLEIAALNQRLKQSGHYSAKLLNEKLIREMAPDRVREKKEGND
ncbi:MAG: HPr(Ser) kinase/phosphatase [Elusimicrobia bacterium]|nr:HPr(Ser) kinase/phosphatase [Elusimicrobiota bacterium]MBU2615265.1 HPr(Ser) kinase/phosphatase [Elusimicrobiota bacterium]